MVDAANSVEEFISKKLHSLLYLEEFVFARNKFKPSPDLELELADAVVMLGDVLLVFQIKERSKVDVLGENPEERWFRSKVLDKATKQIRDTLKYLDAYDEIPVPNERGHVFDLAARSFRNIIKIVVYATPNPLPAECASIRHHVSKTAGFIHIVNATDYLEIGRTLRVPEEVIRYFEYREAVISGFNGSCAELPEAAIAGHFIGGDQKIAPSLNSAKFLHQLVDDSREWDLAPFLRGIHKSLSGDKESNSYYAILIEFAKLPRSMWRQAKERLVLCIEKTRKGEFAQPYRIADPATSTGFVFIPTDAALAATPDWKDARLRGLANMTKAHKYDQRLQKCVGCLVAKEGEWFDILWCYIDYPWETDPELEQFLVESFPFRKVKEAVVYGYKFAADDPAK